MERYFKKGLVLGIIILFLGASILPSISGNFRKMDNNLNIITDSIVSCDWPLYHHDMMHTGYTDCKGNIDCASRNWSYETNGGVYSSVIGDIDNDEQNEVVFTSYNNNIYSFNGKTGAMEWSKNMNTLMNCPLLADIDSDGAIEVVVSAYDGKIYVFNGETSNVEWSFSTGGIIMAASNIGDVDGDGDIEIVFGSNDGYFYVLNGKYQIEEQKYQINANVLYPPTIGDIDNDGDIEIVFSTDQLPFNGIIYVLNHKTGIFEWNYPTGNLIYNIALGDINGDNQKDIVFGSDSKVFALNGKTGLPLWDPFMADSLVTSCPALGDINSDGDVEIVVGSLDNKVYVLNGATGIKKWYYEADGPFGSDPALVDIDSDGVIEVIVGTEELFLSNLYFGISAFDGVTGNKEWRFRTNYFTGGSPALGDIDGDGFIEVLFGCSDNLLTRGGIFALDSEYDIPTITIKRPIKVYEYINDREKGPSNDGKTKIWGYIELHVFSTDIYNIDYVRFYFDDQDIGFGELKDNLFRCMWDAKKPLIWKSGILKATAFTFCGDEISDEMIVWIHWYPDSRSKILFLDKDSIFIEIFKHYLNLFPILQKFLNRLE